MTFVGNTALVLAAAAALFGIAAFLLGTRLGMQFLNRLAHLATFLTASFMTLAVAALLWAILSHNFSLAYVYSESSRDTSFVYLISALWAGNAGSLLFWGWMIAVSGAVLLWRKKVPAAILTYTIPVILITELFFLVLICLPGAHQNPFNSLSPVPTDGMGMNPLLRNLGMVFHPPTLLIGWAFILVPFAMAMGALITRRLDEEWLDSARRWALASWALLGIGNILGAWWAYYELGWGGYWAWDPVENAGLLPWILITAFLHTTMTWRRRGLNKVWSLLFIVFAFLLTIFGAYLTRSSLLNSVHTFGATPAEPIFLIFMACMLIGALTLIIIRLRALKDAQGDDALISGETTFFVNSLLLTLATVAIFIGTMFPFFSRIFSDHVIEQGADFFNRTAVPTFLAVILLSGLCVLVGFKKPKLASFGRALIWPTAGALVSVLILVILGINKWHVLVTAFILAFALFATIAKWIRDIFQHRIGKRENFFRTCHRLFSTNRARYGGYIVHIAIVIIAIGITGSSVYDVHLDVILSPGQSVVVQDYVLTYNGYTPSGTDTIMTWTASFDLERGDKHLGTLNPALSFYAITDQTLSETAVRSTLADDVYISLYSIDVSENIGVVIMINPLVMWIWIGGVVLFIGGLWAFSAPAKKIVNDKDD